MHTKNYSKGFDSDYYSILQTSIYKYFLNNKFK